MASVDGDAGLAAVGTSVHHEPGRPGRAYVVGDANVYQSEDDGQTWSPIPADVLPPSNAWAFDPPCTSRMTG